MSRLTQAIRAGALGSSVTGEHGTIGNSFRFGPEFPGFAGHFPGYPILPAVAQVQTALVLAEDYLGVSLRLKALVNAKFLAQILPEDEIAVTLREKNRGDSLCFEARIHRKEELASAFLIEVAKEEAG